MYDLIIKNANILDGSGSEAFVSDVAIKDGKIAKIGAGLSKAGRVIDATGLTLTPGFIDSHSHSDRAVEKFPDQREKVEQGITFAVAGQCGSSVSIMNIWHVLGSLLDNKKKFGLPTEMSVEDTVRKIREFAPAGILSTARQIAAFKAPDGGMSAGIEHCQTSVYGSPTSMPGSNEGDVNGSACASSALISGVYYGLDLVDLKVPLYSGEDFKKYVSILEEREQSYQNSRKN